MTAIETHRDVTNIAELPAYVPVEPPPARAEVVPLRMTLVWTHGLLLVAGIVALVVGFVGGIRSAVVPIAVGQVLVLVALSLPLAWSGEDRLRHTRPPDVVWLDRDETQRRLVRWHCLVAVVIGVAIGLLLGARPEFALVVGGPLLWGGGFGFFFADRVRRLEAASGRTAAVDAVRPTGGRRRWYLAPGPAPHMATAPASTGNATPVT